MLNSIGFRFLEKSLFFLFLFFILVLLTGCGGTKLLTEPLPIDVTSPLVAVNNDSIRVSLLGIIVRDGPGTWARNADWDEYLLTIANLTDSAIEIKEVNLTDLLGVVLMTNSDRRELVRLSRDMVNRYEDSDLEITSGIGAGTVLTAGGAIIAVGTAAAVSVAPAAALGGAASVGLAPAMLAGAVLLSPVFAVAGLKRMSNVSKVSRVIEERSTDFPLMINSKEEVLIDLFYPLAPSPLQLEINYGDSSGDRNYILNTETVLSGLHILP